MKWRALLSRLRPWLIGLFLLVAAVLLWRYARLVDWAAVAAAIAGYPARQLLLAAAFSLLAYASYCGFDLLARRYTGHTLPARRILPIAFTCYAFNLNLGAMVGGIGFRYRLYSQAGLRLSTTSRIVGFTIVSNWSGFLLLGGLVLVSDAAPLPRDWTAVAPALDVAGWAMLAVVAAGLLLCAFSPRRHWSLRGHAITLPPLPLALAQLLVAIASWLAIAAIVAVLMPDRVGYTTVAGVLLLSVIANLVIRVPANLGVLEAVFIASLGERLGTTAILAALLTYRALFHIGPLLLAMLVYAALELRLRRKPAP